MCPDPAQTPGVLADGRAEGAVREKGFVELIFEAMAPLVDQLKEIEGHGEHFGWSTCAPSYSIGAFGRTGYPTGKGGLTICGCGELLHSTVEVDVPGFQPYRLPGT